MEKKSRIYHTPDSYRKALIETNPNDLDFSKVNFVSRSVKVEVTCRVCKLDFLANPQDLLYKKTGCPACHLKRFSKKSTEKIIPWTEVVERIKKVHGDVYTYDATSYQSLAKKVTIFCKKHGEFSQIVGNHLAGAGCPTCANEIKREKRLASESEVFNRARKIHANLYQYEEGSYIDMKKPMRIICPEHGLFAQLPNDHLDGHGCPRCGNIISKPQEEIFTFIKNLGISAVNNFVLDDGKHLDILCPNEKIAIEYNGLKWHSEEFGRDSKYHLEKTNQAAKQGYRLIHIFEDEYLPFPDKVLDFIKTSLGKNLVKYDARKLSLEIDCLWTEGKKLLEDVHLQGSGVPPEICIGLRDPKTGILVSVMTFDSRNTNPNEIELTRFCSIGVVRGGFSKLLKAAKQFIDGKEIISFSDTRLSQGNVYLANGFKQIGIVGPRYWYVRRGKRYHRRGFQKQYLEKFLENYDPNLTERENCWNHGYFRIWDCGKIKWKLI